MRRRRSRSAMPAPALRHGAPDRETDGAVGGTTRPTGRPARRRGSPGSDRRRARRPRSAAALERLLHQHDPPARRVHLLAQLLVGRTHRQAEAAVHAALDRGRHRRRGGLAHLLLEASDVDRVSHGWSVPVSSIASRAGSITARGTAPADRARAARARSRPPRRAGLRAGGDRGDRARRDPQSPSSSSTRSSSSIARSRGQAINACCPRRGVDGARRARLPVAPRLAPSAASTAAIRPG